MVKRGKDMKKYQYLRAFIVLLAGLITLIINIKTNKDVTVSLLILLCVIIVFYIIATLIVEILQRAMNPPEENEENQDTNDEEEESESVDVDSEQMSDDFDED